MPTAPPRFAERLLRWCLRSAPAGEFILGDLRQEYATVRARDGALRARFWYWGQVVSVGARYLGPGRKRLASEGPRPGGGPTGLVTTAGDIVRDILGVTRVFRTAPGYAAAVVLTLALGLGVNASIFGAVDRVLLRPPEHVQDHGALRFLSLSGLGPRSLNSPLAYSFPDYEAIRDVPALEAAAAYRPRRQVTMGSGVDARRVIVQDATAELFPLLGVGAVRGRFFDAADDRDGAPPVAVLSDAFWQSAFAGDPAAIGRTVTLGTHAYEVIGVAPPGFTGPNLDAVDLWVPLRMNVALTSSWGALESRGAWWHRVVVRLAPGVRDAEAGRQLTTAHNAAVRAAMAIGPPEDHDESLGAEVETGSFITALGPYAETETRITLWLAGVSLLVLLVAVANVANLMLARGVDRQRERAVRLALGVSRRRLLTGALGEGLVLATVGGLLALLVAPPTSRVVYDLLLPGVPMPGSPVSLRLGAFLAVVVLLSAGLAAVLPATQALRTAPGDVLRRARRGSGRGGTRAREALVFGQVGLCAVLLVGAGLFVESLRNALVVDTGFDHEAIINVEFEPQAGVDGDRVTELYREALVAVSSVPGVESAILSSSGRPLYGWDEMHDLRPSRVDSVGALPQGGPFTYAGTEGYVETAGLRIVRGRAFERDEYLADAAPALMVSRSFAEGAWPGVDPLRECVTLSYSPVPTDGPEPCRPVVGVYEDVKRSIGDRDSWSVTWPLPITAPALRGMLVRAAGDPTELVSSIRERVAAVSGDVRYVHVVPMSGRIEAWQGPWRMGATLFTAFGVLALLVAAVGVYSVLAFSVARRRREIGIRAALGAERSALVAMVVRHAVRLVVVGLAAGLVAAVFIGRALDSVLFGVPGMSPGVIGVVAAVLVGAGLLAAWLPARRATAIDPVGAIAAE